MWQKPTFVVRCALCVLTAWASSESGRAAMLPATPSSNLVLHLKADAANVVKDGANVVSQWNDVSGSNFHFNQADLNRQPLWVDSALGGRPVIRFDGLSDWLDDMTNGLTAVDGMPFTYFAVTRGNTNPLAMFDSAPGVVNPFRFFNNNQVELWNASPQLPVTLDAAGSVVSVDAQRNPANLRVMDVRRTGSSNTRAGGIGNNSVVAFNFANIGTINNGGNGYFNGDIAELLLFRGPMTGADRLAVERYLQQEYGLAGSSSSVGAPGGYAMGLLGDGPVYYGRLDENGASAADSADAAGAPQFGPQYGTYTNFAPVDQAVAGPRPTDLVNGLPLLGFEADNLGIRARGNLDGGNDAVLVPDDGNLNFAAGGAYTLSAWVNGSNVQEGGAAIVAKGLGGGGEQFAIDVVNGQYRFFTRNAAGAATVLQSTIALNNTWQHVVGTLDISTGAMKLYVNGVEVGSQLAPATLLNTSHEVSIAARKNANSNNYDLNFDGSIDEVAIFGRALTAGEVRHQFNRALVNAPTPLSNAELAVANDGPIAHWRLEETAPVALDSADGPGAPGFGPQDGSHQGMPLSAAGVAGPRPGDLVGGLPVYGFASDNKAVAFAGDNDGGDDVILVADDGALNFSASGAFSLEAWVKGPAAQESGAAIMARGTGGGGEQFSLDVFNNTFRFFVRDAGGTATVAHSTVGLDDTWQHVAAVFDGVQGVMKVYVNGALVVSVAPPATLLDNAHEVSIGARQNDFGAYDLNFLGSIDEAAIYGRALTAEEVRAHFNAAVVPEPATLAGLAAGLGAMVRSRRRRER